MHFSTSTLRFVTLAAVALATLGAAAAVNSAQEVADSNIHSQGRQLKQGPIQCPAGSFSQTSMKNGMQMVDCVCLAGLYRPKSSKTGDCIACPNGTYKPQGNTACKACAGRSVSAKTGSSKCTECTGNLWPNAAHTMCFYPGPAPKCGTGGEAVYSSSNGFSCQCKRGWTPTRDSSAPVGTCIKCPKGSTSSPIGPGDCTKCIGATFSGVAGASKCSTCKAPRTVNASHTSCNKPARKQG